MKTKPIVLSEHYGEKAADNAEWCFNVETGSSGTRETDKEESGYQGAQENREPPIRVAQIYIVVRRIYISTFMFSYTCLSPTQGVFPFIDYILFQVTDFGISRSTCLGLEITKHWPLALIYLLL